MTDDIVGANLSKSIFFALLL